MADRVEPTAAEQFGADDRIDHMVDRAIGRRGMRPRTAAYLVVILWLIAIVGFGIFERLADPKTFPNIWLSFWWAIQTVTTVGYGDVVPHETAGKVVASILMVGGLAFLSIVTALITSSFVARRQEHAQARGEDPVMQQLAKLSRQVASLEAELRRAREADETERGPNPP